MYLDSWPLILASLDLCLINPPPTYPPRIKALIRPSSGKRIVKKPSLRVYFWGEGYVRGGWLISHYSRAIGEDQKPREEVGPKKDEDDTLKATTIVLPTLSPPSAGDAGLTCGDWLAQLRPLIGDLATTALTWWDAMLFEVTKKYQLWLAATPLERLTMEGPQKKEYNTSAGRQRMDLRASSLLMASLPAGLKGELIAARELSTGKILFKVLKTFQPGGASERATTLTALTIEVYHPETVHDAEGLQPIPIPNTRGILLHPILPHSLRCPADAYFTQVSTHHPHLHRQPTPGSVSYALSRPFFPSPIGSMCGIFTYITCAIKINHSCRWIYEFHRSFPSRGWK